MKKIFSKLTKSSIISSVALIAFAILLIVQSEATIMAVSYVIGGILIAIGVLAELQFIKNIKENPASMEIVYGIVCVILGIIVITNPQEIASVIPLVIGFIIIINSVAKLSYSLELRKEKNDLWLATLVLSIIMTICGVLLIFNPFQGAIFITRIVGIFILVYAVLDLISTFVIINTLKKMQAIVVKTEVTEATIEEEPVEEVSHQPAELNMYEEANAEDITSEETTKKKKKKKDK